MGDTFVEKFVSSCTDGYCEHCSIGNGYSFLCVEQCIGYNDGNHEFLCDCLFVVLFGTFFLIS